MYYLGFFLGFNDNEDEDDDLKHLPDDDLEQVNSTRC